MLELIQCYCGNRLGRVYKAYAIAKAYRTKEQCDKVGIDLDNIPLIDGNQIDMTDIFEDLRIKRTCCRMALTTTTLLFNIPDAYSRENASTNNDSTAAV